METVSMKNFSQYITEGFDIPVTSHDDVDKLELSHPEEVKRLLDYITPLKLSSVPIAGGTGGDSGKIKIRGAKTNPDALGKIKSWAKDNAPNVKYAFGDGSLRVSGEKKPSGADWENIITAQFNSLVGSPNFDSDAQKAAKEFPSYEQMGMDLAKAFKDKVGSSPIVQYGAGKSKANLSNFWLEHGGVDGTPKTDMYNKDYNISLKKSGGSQLASGAKGETVATYQAALEYLGERGVTPELQKILDLIEENFTKIYTEHTKTALDKMAVDKKGNLNPKDQAAVEQYITTDAFHNELNKQIQKHLTFDKNPEFLKWFTFEAMCGYKKFSNKQAAASVCLEFNAAKGTVSKFLEVVPGGKSSGLSGNPKASSDVISVSSKVKVYVAWKSTTGNPYSTLRLGLTEDNKSIQELPTLASIIREEIKTDKIANMILNESVHQLDEFAIVRKTIASLKKMGKNVKLWFTSLMQRIMKKIKEVVSKIKDLGSKMYQGLFGFLGIEIRNVKTSFPRDIEGFI